MFCRSGFQPWTGDRRGGALSGLLLLLALGASVVFAGTHHVVNTSDGIRVYQKARFGFHSTYVDMTNTSFLGLRKHPELVATMAAEGDLVLLPGGETMIEMMEGMGVAAARVNEIISRFDSEGEIRRNLGQASVHAGERLLDAGERAANTYRELDDRYNITDRTRDAAERGARGLNRLLDRRD